MKTSKLIISIAIILIALRVTAQETGIIKGTLTDEKGKTMPFASVAIMEDSTIVASQTTNDQGDFTFKQLTPGKYNVQFSFFGYATKSVKGVEVTANQTSYVNRTMELKTNVLTGVVVTTDAWTKPIINPTFSTVTPITIDQIEKSPAGKGDIIGLMVMVTPGVLATSDGKDIYMRGSRRGSTGYYVDGVKIIGSADVPGSAIEGMEVLTGGVPAEYGDCTGGIVIITTKDFKTEMRRKEMKRREKMENESN